VYLATVMDSFTREVVAWQLGWHHTSQLDVDALVEAVRKRGRVPQLFHSDQGSEYTSQACVQWLVRQQILPSNSPKGKPWNNGR
jgi:putative transposase